MSAWASWAQSPAACVEQLLSHLLQVHWLAASVGVHPTRLEVRRKSSNLVCATSVQPRKPQVSDKPGALAGCKASFSASLLCATFRQLFA